MPTRPHAKFSRLGKGAHALLGELELAVMRVAWKRRLVTVREVLIQLNKKRRLAYTTVMTVMSRLADKGLLVAEKSGKSYRYQAGHTQAEFEARAARQVIQSLITDFGGDMAISQFINEMAQQDPGQLDRLAELAQQARTKHNES
jgi:predicted transcriptional regulator